MNTEKLVYSVQEMARALDIGVNKAYDLTRIEGFPCVRLGERRVVIPVNKLHDWLEKQASGDE